jgi:hypothetical protein
MTHVMRTFNKKISNTYFETLSAAVDQAVKEAESKGYTIDEDDRWQEFGTDGIEYGKTRKGSIGLFKNDVPQKKMLQVSIYRMDSGRYELTSYIN